MDKSNSTEGTGQKRKRANSTHGQPVEGTTPMPVPPFTQLGGFPQRGPIDLHNFQPNAPMPPSATNMSQILPLDEHFGTPHARQTNIKSEGQQEQKTRMAGGPMDGVQVPTFSQYPQIPYSFAMAQGQRQHGANTPHTWNDSSGHRIPRRPSTPYQPVPQYTGSSTDKAPMGTYPQSQHDYNTTMPQIPRQNVRRQNVRCQNVPPQNVPHRNMHVAPQTVSLQNMPQQNVMQGNKEAEKYRTQLEEVTKKLKEAEARIRELEATKAQDKKDRDILILNEKAKNEKMKALVTSSQQQVQELTVQKQKIVDRVKAARQQAKAQVHHLHQAEKTRVESMEQRIAEYHSTGRITHAVNGLAEFEVRDEERASLLYLLDTCFDPILENEQPAPSGTSGSHAQD